MTNINIFFIFSIIGYLYESIVNLIQNGTFNSGFMSGIVTPIYGVGVLIIIYIYNKTNNKIKTCLLSMIILTILEFICGNLLYILFKRIYWDYSNLYFSIGKYIALEVSIIWTILSYIVILIYNKTIKYIKKIPTYITYISIVLFIIDLVYTLITI